MTEMAIRYRGVSKVYPDGTAAVQDLDLDIPQGSLTVFVGPSGCGKTTSLRMLNRMVDPTSGVVEVDGQDVSTIPAAKLRRSMGYVMQQSGLLPHKTVEDNIATVPRLNGVSKRASRDAARQLLASVGLDESLATRYPAQLSGGQQQRVGVARALAADPPILLMDEPFSAVDPVVRQDLQHELLDLQHRLHRTIVFVTHDIDEAVLLGNRVAVFARGGRLAQYATPEELLRSPADDFVADFIGRDRGFRSLGFDSATVSLQPVAALVSGTGERTLLGPGTGDGAPGARPAPWQSPTGDPDWLLVVDERRHPLGWLPVSASGEPASHDQLRVGGTLWHDGDSLRTALDAALSSPSGQAVAVNGDGSVAGVVPGADVMRAIEQRRSARHDRPVQP